MGDKEPKRAYNRPLQVRVSEEQYALFEEAAVLDGRSLSNWARERLVRIAKRELAKAEAGKTE